MADATTRTPSDESDELAGLLGDHVWRFGQSFGSAADVRCFFSPGRVNLMGAHLDYNGGPVMPMAIDRGTLIALRERDDVIDRVIALKGAYPGLIKANIGALELMRSDRCLDSTGERGENCSLRRMLPLYMGDGGQFERTFCCYGNDVDCSRCGAYAVFNSQYHRLRGEPDPEAGIQEL